MGCGVMAIAADVEVRARRSLGRADRAIHTMVAELLTARNASGVLADIGCGRGDLATRCAVILPASSGWTPSGTTGCPQT